MKKEIKRKKGKEINSLITNEWKFTNVVRKKNKQHYRIDVIDQGKYSYRGDLQNLNPSISNKGIRKWSSKHNFEISANNIDSLNKKIKKYRWKWHFSS